MLKQSLITFFTISIFSLFLSVSCSVSSQGTDSYDGDEGNNDPPTSGLPPAPTNLQVWKKGQTFIEIHWNVPAVVNGYNVYYKDDLLKEWECLINGQYSTHFKHEGLEPNTSYYYCVSAVNNYGEGPTSDVFEVKTKNLEGNIRIIALPRYYMGGYAIIDDQWVYSASDTSFSYSGYREIGEHDIYVWIRYVRITPPIEATSFEYEETITLTVDGYELLLYLSSW